MGDSAPCPDCSLVKELAISDAKLADKKKILLVQISIKLQILANSQSSSKPSDVAEISNKTTGQASNESHLIPLYHFTQITQGIPPACYGTTFSY